MRVTRLPLASLALFAALAGCQSPHVGVGEGEPCTSEDACATGLVCAGSVCRVPESTGSCSPGARVCDGRRVLACSADGVGFAEAEICSGGCREGLCVEKICEPHVVSCDGDALVRCREDGRGNDQLERCALGCDGATSACVTQSCRPGTRRCADANRAVETCDDRGQGFVKEVCDATTQGLCEAVAGPSGASARCVTRACNAGVKRCNADALVVCEADGGGERLLSTCDFGCRDAACVPAACVAGVRRCSGDAVESCAPNRSGFLLLESCPAGCLADGSNARCRPVVCAPLVTRCTADGRGVARCGADGRSWESPVSCASSETCDVGACVAAPVLTCSDGALRCAGNRIEICQGGAFVEKSACIGTCREGTCDTRGECTPLALDVALLLDTEAAPADGTSTFLVVSRPLLAPDRTPLANGTPVTVSLRAADAELPAALLVPDADASLAGVQVHVLNGRIDFSLRAPRSTTREIVVTVAAQIAGQPLCAGTRAIRFVPATGDRFVADDFLTQRSRDASRGTGAAWDVGSGTLSVGAFDAGDGRDGALVVAPGERVDLGARLQSGRAFSDMASTRVLDIRGDRLALEGSLAPFAAGTRVMLVNVRSVAGRTKSVGVWELATVAGEDRGLLRLTAPIERILGEPDNSADSLVAQSVRLIRLPQYTHVSIDGQVTGPAFDGAAGGVLAFFAQSQATSGNARNRLGATGLVTMKGRGYRGATQPAQPTLALSGESLAGQRDTAGIEPQLGAGGGGYQCGSGAAPVVAASAPPPGNSASAFFGSAGSHATQGESTCSRAGQAYAPTTFSRMFFGSGSGSQHESVYFACPQHQECCTQYKTCCTQYNACCTQYSSCCTQYNSCCTQYNSCCYERTACNCTRAWTCTNKAICGCEFGHCCGFLCLGGCDGCGSGEGAKTCTDTRCGCDSWVSGSNCACTKTGVDASCGCEPGATKPAAQCGCEPGANKADPRCGCVSGKDGEQAACGCALPLERDVQCGCEPGAFKRDAMCGCQPREDRWKNAYGGASGGGLVYIVAGALDLSASGARIDASGDDALVGLYGGAGGTVVVRTPALALGGPGRLWAAGGARAGAGRVLLDVAQLDDGFADSWVAPAATRTRLELPAAWSVKVADLAGLPRGYGTLRVFALARAFSAGDPGGVIDGLFALAASDAALSVAMTGGAYVLVPPAASLSVTDGRSLAWTLRTTAGTSTTTLRALAFRLVTAP